MVCNCLNKKGLSLEPRRYQNRIQGEHSHSLAFWGARDRCFWGARSACWSAHFDKIQVIRFNYIIQFRCIVCPGWISFVNIKCWMESRNLIHQSHKQKKSQQQSLSLDIQKGPPKSQNDPREQKERHCLLVAQLLGNYHVITDGHVPICQIVDICRRFGTTWGGRRILKHGGVHCRGLQEVRRGSPQLLDSRLFLYSNIGF